MSLYLRLTGVYDTMCTYIYKLISISMPNGSKWDLQPNKHNWAPPLYELSYCAAFRCAKSRKRSSSAGRPKVASNLSDTLG